jgi:glycine/serine hydroxymethyltransferase
MLGCRDVNQCVFPATLTGRDYKIAAYGVNRETELIDLDEVRHLALWKRPKLIIAGGSAYPQPSTSPTSARSLTKSTYYEAVWGVREG